MTKIELKKYSKECISELDARDEYNRLSDIYNKTKGCKYFKVPKPISLQGRIIEMEYIDGYSFHELKNKYDIEEIFFKRIGHALGELHRSINTSLDLKKPVELHRDFYSKNIMVTRNNVIYFIDFNKPRIIKSFTRDLVYRDLAYFIMGILYKYPIKNIYLRGRNKNRKFMSLFLQAYSKEINNKLDYALLRKYLEKALNEELTIIKSNSYLQYYIWKFLFKSDFRKIKLLFNSYSKSHLGKYFGKKYDGIYINTVEKDIFDYEKKVLIQLLKANKFKKALDFACGTGRILEIVQSYSSEIHGLDISKDMLVEAEKKIRNKNVKLICADVFEDEAVVNRDYNLITCFRFFLNADYELRKKSLRLFRKILTDDGFLVINNHGNKWSLRKFYVSLKSQSRELSEKSLRELLEDNGFIIKKRYPVNFLPKIFLKLPFSVGIVFDRLLLNMPLLKNYCINYMYICKKNEK